MSASRKNWRPLGVASAVALAVAGVVMASLLLVPSFGSGKSEPRPAAGTADAPGLEISASMAAKLKNEEFDFTQDIAQRDVPVAQVDAVKSAEAAFGTLLKGKPASVASLGHFTNRKYGKAREDGSTDPFIANRPAWVVIYEGVPQGKADMFGGKLRGKEVPDFVGVTDWAVVVDAHSGEVLGASTISAP